MNCVISYAQNGREDYTAGMRRMAQSIIDQAKKNVAMILVSPDADYGYVGTVPVNRPWRGMPQHQHVPYGFKPWLFKTAFDAGFNCVLWCDSTIQAIKPIEEIFDAASHQGLFVGDNPGCEQRTWCSDDALDAMGCPRDARFNQIMACSLAIDIAHPAGRAVFDGWWALCNDGVTFAGRGGSVRPEFRGHRHDQAALSWLCEKNYVHREPYGRLCYWSDRSKYPNAVLCNRGIYER